MTRIIGFTPTEFAAAERGAHLMLGVEREGMEPISDGQELLAIEGWKHGDEPRTDVRRVRLIVDGNPFAADVGKLTDEQIAQVTGYQVAELPDLARQRMAEHIFHVNSDMRGGLPREVLCIPYRQVPL